MRSIFLILSLEIGAALLSGNLVNAQSPPGYMPPSGATPPTLLYPTPVQPIAAASQVELVQYMDPSPSPPPYAPMTSVPPMLAAPQMLAAPPSVSVPLAPQYLQSFFPQSRSDNFWIQAEYLVWFLQGADAPPLLTTSPAGTNRFNAGVLNNPATQILVGNEMFGDDARSGFRVELGRWFPVRQGIGLHGAYYRLDDDSTSRSFNGGSTPILARPFFSVEPGFSGPNADLVAFPNELSGNITVRRSESFDGAEVMLHKILVDGVNRIQLIGGYQYNGLDDDVTISDFKQVIGPSSGLAIGTTLAERDTFETENQFHGGAIGTILSAENCRWHIDLASQIALGVNHGIVRTSGSTTSSVPNGAGGNDVVTTDDGLLVLDSNRGTFKDDRFTVIPQLHAKLGYDIFPQLRATVGYRFLYWGQVLRAAEQIDTGVNLSQLDPGGVNGEPRPTRLHRYSDLRVQGINLGLDYRF